jgi:hypothetical protein
MELFALFVQLGFGILLAALIIIMVVALLWFNAASEKGAYLNACCALALLLACLFAAILLADIQKKETGISIATPAASEGVLF